MDIRVVRDNVELWWRVRWLAVGFKKLIERIYRLVEFWGHSEENGVIKGDGEAHSTLAAKGRRSVNFD